MDENIKKEKNVSIRLLFISILITILISVPFGYVLGSKCFSDKKIINDCSEIENSKEENDDNDEVVPSNEEVKTNEEVKANEVNKEIGYITEDDINTIKSLFPSFDRYIENILENAGYSGVSLSGMMDYVTNNLSSNDLFNDDRFKFSFVFHIGHVLYKDKYIEDWGTGGWSISVENFEELYKKLYLEDYDFTAIPTGTKFQLNNNRIYGAIYSGYSPKLYFDLVTGDNKLTANIYDYNFTGNNGKGSTYYGVMNLVFEKDNNNVYSFKHFYLSK